MSRYLISAILVVAALPLPLHAREYYYFNRPNVSREQYVADRDECDRLAGGAGYSGPGVVYTSVNSNLTTSQVAAVAGIAGLFAGLMRNGEVRRLQQSVERTCMADKGYLRYRVDKAVVSTIEQLKAPELRVERYFALAAAKQPIGERIKE